MNERQNSTNHAHSNLPINEDTSVETTIDAEPKIGSIKPVYRPPEKFSEPVKPYFKWIWLAIVVLVILAWIFLFWYFSAHHAPSSAPL